MTFHCIFDLINKCCVGEHKRLQNLLDSIETGKILMLIGGTIWVNFEVLQYVLCKQHVRFQNRTYDLESSVEIDVLT